jgi:diacylglycerol kinase (ATP)
LRIALVYHFAAEGRRIARVDALASALETRGHSLTRHDSAAFRFAEHAPQAELLCICGGDGTARLVVGNQGASASLPRLAVYPLGTINLLARELGYPGDPRRFAARIGAEGPGTNSLLAVAGEQTFLACASVGFDANVVAAVSLWLKARIGRFAYVAALAASFWSWPVRQLTITADGEQLCGEAVFVLRGKFYAGPWTLDRNAGLEQAKLHVLVMPRARRRDLFMLAAYMIGGARNPRADWQFLKVSQIDVAAAGDVAVQADGDIIGSAPIRFRVTDRIVWWA